MGWARYVLPAVLFVSPGFEPVQAEPQVPARPLRFCQQHLADARTIKLGDAYPFARAMQDQSYGLGSGCVVVSFYRTFDPTLPQTIEQRRGNAPSPPPDLTPRFVARRVMADRDSPDGRTGSTSWAVQETCPALAPALDDLSSVTAMKFTGNRPHDGEGFTMDGVGYELWVDGQVYPFGQGDYKASLKMESNVGTPLAKWTAATLDAMKSCWSDRKPQ